MSILSTNQTSGPAQLQLPGPGTKEGALMQSESIRSSGRSDLFDAIEKVQTAVEKTSTATTPARVTQTLHRGPGNKGLKYPATPVYGADADLILEALYNPSVHSTGKWASKWGPIRHRNRTVMAVARGTGMRIHELLLLRPDDIDAATHQVTVRRGKNGKRRLIAILPDALAELEAWLIARTAMGFGPDDPLFPVIEGPTRGTPIKQGYMRKQLHKAAREAGVTIRAVPHQWRHGHAVELHRRHVPIGILQRQLGHSSPATTGIYLAGISAEEVIEAVLGAFE